MSKFIDKLKQSSQMALQPVGFRTTLTSSIKPRMLLVAVLPEAAVNGLFDYVEDADAGLLLAAGLSSGIKKLGKVTPDVPAIPWGVWLKDNCGGGVKTLPKTGGDFIVFQETSTPLAFDSIDKVGKILEVAASLNEGFLRAVNELPIDAVLVNGEKKGSLTWHDLILYQRLTGLLTKPVLVSVPQEITAVELQMLWDVGVAGILAEVDVTKSAGGIKDIHGKIAKLSLPTSDKRGKAGMLLPHINVEKNILTDTEEEEDEYLRASMRG